MSSLPCLDTPDAMSSPARVSRAECLVFQASGSEYFRIWIVNLFLTMVTLGIYAAWAKVRKTKYLYGATSLAGTAFEYHGNPAAILKGRLLALTMLIAYQVAFKFSLLLGCLLLGAFVVMIPWLIWKSLQYKLHNSSYRGVRFSFRGKPGEAYRVFLGLPLLSLFTLGLLHPFVHQRLKRYQHGQSYYGQTPFRFDATPKQFYGQYLIVLGMAAAGFLAISAAIGASGIVLPFLPAPYGKMVLIAVAAYLWGFTLLPVVTTLIHNLVWNHTRIGDSRFYSRQRWPRIVYLALTNLLLIVCTLGLFIPFAQIRMLRYRLTTLTITLHDNPDTILAATRTEPDAIGEGISDLLGFDISL